MAVINTCIDQEAGHKQISQSLWDSCPTEGRRAAIARQEHTFPNGIYKNPLFIFYAVLEDSLQACVEKARLYNKRPGVDY